MTYQYEEISPEQARQLLDRYVSPEEWQKATDFMRKMYGGQAHTLYSIDQPPTSLPVFAIRKKL